MSARRAFASLLVAFAGAFVALPAVALAPCHDVCHLAQGTPLLLTDVRQIWLRQCLGEEDGPTRCVVKRLKLDGTVLETRAAPTLFDHDFDERHLRKHELATLSRRTAWEDLRQPLPIGPFGDESATRVRLDGATLTLTTKTGAPQRRALPCEPKRVVVFAGAAKGVGAVVATVRCATSAGVEAETGVVFSAAPTDLTSF